MPNAPAVNNEQRILELRQKQQEREAAAKAVEEADKKVREGDKQALKEMGTMVIDTLTPVGDVKAAWEWINGDKNWRSNLAMVLTVLGGSQAKGKADELADLIEAQARDAKLWMKQQGKAPPIEVREAYKQHGVDFDEVKPAPMGERNEKAFPAKKDEPIYDAEGDLIGNKADRQMVEYSQAQHNPGATAGLKPQAPAPQGSTIEEVGNIAVRNHMQWRKGWDAEAFKKHVSSALSTKTREAAKGKAGGVPEFWIYDEAKKGLVVVKRDKDGALYIGAPKGRPPDVFKRYTEGAAKGKVMRDPNGNPILSDKIDMVVPSDAEGEANKMIYELALERLDMK